MSSVKVNLAFNTVYQLLVLFLPLVTAPYLSRVIGAEGIGVYSYSYSIATYFVYFVMLGLNNYGNRTIASCRDSKETLSKTFWSIYAMQVCCFVVVGILYVAFVFLFSNNVMIAALQGIYVCSALFDINWFFFGLEKFKITVTRNAIIKTLTTVLIFVLVQRPDDVGVYVLIMSVGFLVTQLCLWPFVRGLVMPYRPKWSDIKVHILPNLKLFVPVVAISIYSLLSKIILGAIAGEEAVGYFENAVKLYAVPGAFVAAVGTVMLPRVSNLFAQNKFEQATKYLNKTMFLVMAFTMYFAFMLPSIAVPFSVLFFGEGFEASGYVLIILSAAIPMLGFGNVVRSQYLIPSSNDSVYLWSAVYAAIANVVVNLLLIPQIGVIGSAVASLTSELIVVLYQSYKVRNEIPIARFVKYTLLFLFSGLFMLVLTTLVFSDGSGWLYVFEKGLLATAIYGVEFVAIFVFMRKRSKKGESDLF